jgi:gliding motility-associated-like protein
LLKTPVIPSVFTPNGDGIHDKWVIKHLESYPGCVVEIYNRYGQSVYKMINYSAPWDGRVNGKDLPVGTYYYIIDPKNGRQPIKGSVTIIR